MANIVFVGIGGVGGYFGGKMTQLLKGGNDTDKVFFIARGKHLAAIKESGLLLKTEKDGILTCIPTLATDDIEELPPIDICFVCVKQYDLEAVIHKLEFKICADTKIIPLLNGIDNYQRIRRVTDRGIVFPACVYVGTHIEAPGIVHQSGGAGTIIFGKDPLRMDAGADDICKLMDAVGIKYSWSETYREEIWSKYMFIAAYGLVTAAEKRSLGEVFENQELGEKVKNIMAEIRTLSLAEGIHLPEDIVQTCFSRACNFPYEARTSLQRDVESAAEYDERELFGQTIVDLGKKYGIQTPETEEVYRKLNSISVGKELGFAKL